MKSNTKTVSALLGKRAVICEEQGVVVLQLRRALQTFGMSVVGCEASGDACVKAVIRERPDLVLMDVSPQGLDSFRVANRVMAEYPTCILMLSTHYEKSWRHEVVRAGVIRVIYKPITSELLLPNLVEALQEFQAVQPK